jgi:type IV pilus assembly protein PilB
VDEVPKSEAPKDLMLPDADEVMDFMANCMIEDVVIDHELYAEDAEVPAPMLELDGIPLLSPLELDLAPSQHAPMAMEVLSARVLVHGWGADATAGLLRVLDEAGIPARIASAAEVRAARENAVVVSPLPSLEALGQRVAARLLVAGKDPENELKRAQAVGALGFLAAPVDPELMLRAVRRLLRLGSEPFVRVS